MLVGGPGDSSKIVQPGGVKVYMADAWMVTGKLGVLLIDMHVPMILRTLLLRTGLWSLGRDPGLAFLRFPPSSYRFSRLIGLLIFHFHPLLEAEKVLWFLGGGGMCCCTL